MYLKAKIICLFRTEVESTTESEVIKITLINSDRPPVRMATIVTIATLFYNYDCHYIPDTDQGQNLSGKLPFLCIKSA